jgi:Escherichia/Staphylococcus phage prohead protease
VQGRTDPSSGVRRLDKIDLWEISVVTFPMLPDARVSAVKRRHVLRPRDTRGVAQV